MNKVVFPPPFPVRKTGALAVAFFLTLGLTMTRAEGESMIQLRLREQNEKLNITVYDSLVEATIRTDLNYREFKRDFAYLFNCLRFKLEPDQEKVNHLSSVIVLPLKSRIEAVRRINFIVDNDQLTFPLDILLLDSRPLFLVKEISYSFRRLKNTGVRDYSGAQGLIIRDETTDPQDACSYVDYLFGRSEFILARDFEFDQLKTKVDFLLISAHGGIVNEEGQIRLGNDVLTAQSLKGCQFNLVYFDSCDQGVSGSFAEALTAIHTSFFVAPIVKNEAGNSSTMTIKTFFRLLREGKSVPAALRLTKVQLFEKFKSAEAGLLYWYAYPMRAYEL